MANRYITLDQSNGTGATHRHFRVLQGGMRTITRKTQQLEQSLSGKLDLTEGGFQTSYELILKVRAVEEERDFGTLADLEAFYRLNNPLATPSNRLRFSDHLHDYVPADSSTYIQVAFVGELAREPLTYALDTDSAWFFVPVNLVEF